MVKIHWVRENERPSEANLAAEKPWDWCEKRLGNLTPIRSEGPPQLTAQDDRPDLAPFRGAQFVVIHLEEPQPGYEAGYYHASITPQELKVRLREG